MTLLWSCINACHVLGLLWSRAQGSPKVPPCATLRHLRRQGRPSLVLQLSPTHELWSVATCQLCIFAFNTNSSLSYAACPLTGMISNGALDAPFTVPLDLQHGSRAQVCLGAPFRAQSVRNVVHQRTVTPKQ